ncbi:hypothetical protein ACWGIR_30945 [Streptomyces albidoflavus]
MNPEDNRADQWRADIAFRGQALRNFPEGHPARELFLAESAHLADQITKDTQAQQERREAAARRETNSARVVGILIAVLGCTLCAFRIPEGDWLLWTGVGLAALGALIVFGASA